MSVLISAKNARGLDCSSRRCSGGSGVGGLKPGAFLQFTWITVMEYMCLTNDNGYVPFVVITTPHSLLPYG